jgi:RNA polymerase sigma factor (sigma-70 family)
MKGTTLHMIARLCRNLGAEGGGLHADEMELLARFTSQRDEAAFAALLDRHGRLVWGVCRGLLPNDADAEDAFQATFVALYRGAATIRHTTSLAPWLHRAATRIAKKARLAAARRRARERRVARPETAATAVSDHTWEALDLAVHEEINLLPATLHVAFVLCVLQGHRHQDAAAQLGVALGTVSARVSRARSRLLERLSARGLAPAVAAAAVACLATSVCARVPTTLLHSVHRHLADGFASMSSTILDLAGTIAGGISMTKWLSTTLIAAVLLVGAGGVWHANAHPQAADDTDPDRDPVLAPSQPQPPEKKTKRSDAFGDPLPEGAVARLGSLRLYDDTIVRRIVFSPDGKWVVSSNNSAVNRLWDARSGKELPLADDLTWPDTKFIPTSEYFATTDRLVAVKKAKDRLILWDVASAKEIGRLPLVADASRLLALSPDGKTLACSSYLANPGTRGKLVFVDVAKGTVRHSVDLGDGNSIWRLTFSADSSTLAVHCVGNTVDVWDVKTHTVRFSFAFDSQGQPPVALSPDGRMVATAPRDRKEKHVRLWDVRAKKELEPLPAELKQPKSRFNFLWSPDVAFSPDGMFLAVTYETEVGVWNLAARKVVQRLKGNGPGLGYPVFARDGKKLAASDGRWVALWDLTTGEPCHDFGHGYAIDAVAFSPDGRTIVTGGEYTDHVVRTWDALSGKIKGRWRGHKGGIEATAYAPDGKLVASSSEDGTVRLWDVATGKEVGCLDAQDGMVHAIAFSPDGKTLASGGERKVVHLWDVATRKEDRSFGNPGGAGTVCLAFSPDGQTLASRGAAESRVRTWDVAVGTQRHEFGGLSAGNDRFLGLGRPMLSFASDNRTLAVNCDDGTVHLLDVTTGKKLRVLGESQFAGHVGGGGAPGGGGPASCPCLGTTFAPDGRSLAASYDASYNPNYSNRIRVWELASGRERTHFERHHDGFVKALAYSPDGTLLVTGGTDRTALVWDLFGLRTADRKTGGFARADADRLWADLGDVDAAKAFGAMKVLRANGMPAVRMLKERLRPAQGVDPKKIARLIADLNQEDFSRRARATTQLAELADLAEPALRAALEDRPTPEKRRRVEDLLKRLDAAASPALLRGVRAVEVLESLGTPEARQVLHILAQGAAEARLTREAKASVERRKW